MKPPGKQLSDLDKPKRAAVHYDKPTPAVSRRPPARVLTAAEKAAFLASRPDLKPKT